MYVNGRSGTIGRLRLGMALAAAKQVIPQRYFFDSLPGGGETTFCWVRHADACVGLDVAVYDPECPFLRCPQRPPLDIIVVELASTRGLKLAQRPVTDRGLRLGDRVSRIRSLYRAKPKICRGEPGAGPTYFSRVGGRTMFFGTYRRKVWAIGIEPLRLFGVCPP